jgi:orotate phosphoribosyltransferase
VEILTITYTKEDMFKDICYTLRQVGESLETNPKTPRPFKLASERLPILARYLGNRHLIFLVSYLKLLSDDLWFNVMTDNSAKVSVIDRDKLMQEAGKVLKELSTSLQKRRTTKIFDCYFRLSDLWYEVYNLSKEKVETGMPKEGDDLLTKATKKAVTKSVNILRSGFPSDWHLDLDSIFWKPKEASKLSTAYVDKIKGMQQRGIRVDKLAFIDNVYGPVGAIALMSAIVSGTNIDSVIVRLRRRVPIGQIKGAEMKKDDCVLIVSDVLTTGDSILKGAEIIRKYATVNQSLVYLDRGEGGRKRLELHGIAVETIKTPDTLDVKPKPLPLGGDELFPLTSV